MQQSLTNHYSLSQTHTISQSLTQSFSCVSQLFLYFKMSSFLHNTLRKSIESCLVSAGLDFYPVERY